MQSRTYQRGAHVNTPVSIVIGLVMAAAADCFGQGGPPQSLKGSVSCVITSLNLRLKLASWMVIRGSSLGHSARLFELSEVLHVELNDVLRATNMQPRYSIVHHAALRLWWTAIDVGTMS